MDCRIISHSSLQGIDSVLGEGSTASGVIAAGEVKDVSELTIPHSSSSHPRIHDCMNKDERNVSHQHN